jgi:hypothetical protein
MSPRPSCTVQPRLSDDLLSDREVCLLHCKESKLQFGFSSQECTKSMSVAGFGLKTILDIRAGEVTQNVES